MPATARSTMHLAVASTTLVLVATPYAMAAGSAEMLESALDLARRGSDALAIWVAAGYQRRPLVMIGLAGVLLLPLLVIAGLILHRKRPAVAVESAAETTAGADMATAWVEIDDSRRITLPPERTVVQIGRDHDNDICLDDDTVHRYHAVIERSRGLGFTITDVGGPDGNGVTVNGERLARGVLADGDTIGVGRTTLRFATAA